MSSLSSLVYNDNSDIIAVNNNTALVVRAVPYEHYEESFDQEPPIETVNDPTQVKDRIMDYIGGILARCFYDKNLLSNLERDAHTTLRHVGILLPSELEIKMERSNLRRPKLVIYEYNMERTFKRRICYLQMIMLAGK